MAPSELNSGRSIYRNIGDSRTEASERVTPPAIHSSLLIMIFLETVSQQAVKKAQNKPVISHSCNSQSLWRYSDSSEENFQSRHYCPEIAPERQ